MKHLYLTLFLILTYSHSLAQIDSSQASFLNLLTVTSDFTTSNLQNYTYVLSTIDSTLTVEEAILLKEQHRLVGQEIPDLGMDARYHWVSFRVKNSSTNVRRLVSYLHLNELNDVSFYLVNRVGKVLDRNEHLDSYTHFARKPIPNSHFAFPFTLHPGEEVSLYWRIHRKHGSVVFPFRLYDIEAFYNYLNIYQFLAYLSYGLLAFTSLLSLILYITTKRRLLLDYSGYCFFYLLLCLSNEGVLKQVFHLDARYVEDNARSILSCLLLYFIVTFSSGFLDLKSYTPKWTGKLTRTLSIGSLLLAIFIIALPLSSSLIALTTVNIFAVLIFVSSFIFYGIYKRKRAAFIYFIALFPFFFNSLWLTANVLFDVEVSWPYYVMILYQTIFEFVILGLEMAYRMITEREESLQRLAALKHRFTSDILEAQDSERQRIAADLHDDLGGTLATIRIRINRARQLTKDLDLAGKELAGIEPLIQKTSEDLRRISHNLMPPEFERIGLDGSLQHLVTAVSHEQTSFEFFTTGVPRQLPVATALNIYRIVSELVTNIIKHANASQASVQLLYFDDFLRIVVEDDGIGSQTGAVRKNVGIGLKNNLLRAEYIGATLRRETSPAGTLIILELPYRSTYENNPTSKSNLIS